MKVEQIYTGCLAQGAYYIVSNGEAAIIDPLRETAPYLERLKNDNVTLKYIFETHFHADFVSGHLDLSQQTGASIVYGPNANCNFEAIVAKDEELFHVGNVQIKVLHTPGHTLESTCYLLIDENGTETALFSGDTLFLGDVGRPDLAQKAADMTQEELAGMLYESLMTKIVPLHDAVTVYPGHGAGSACGKNMMKETVDTLGNQKKMNYALNQPSKEAFIEAVTEGLLPPPAYFGANVAMNKQGYERFEDVKLKGLTALDIETFEQLRSKALIIDTRDSGVFSTGFIPNSINIGIKGDFAPWVGALVADVKQPILFIAEEGQELEVVTRLSRVGFDQLLGYLAGGFETWKNAGKQIDTVNRITAEEFEKQAIIGSSIIIDVRKESEYEAQHVSEAYSKPLAYIHDWISTIDVKNHFFLHCAGGYRSMIAASLLKSKGITNFSEIAGGFNAISKTQLPTTDFVCQSKVLK